MSETNMGPGQRYALGEVRSRAGEYDQLRRKLADKRAALHAAIGEAVTMGVPSSVVATAAGVSRGRVSQIAPVPSPVETRIHAQENGGGAWRDADDATVLRIPDTPAGMVAGIVSARKRNPYGKPTLFVDTRETTDLGVILDRAHAQGATRVLLSGPTPINPTAGATQAEAVRAWALVADAWGWSAGDHYLADPTLPVLRFTNDETKHRVTVLRAASWWGETDASRETCVAAWSGLGAMLDGVAAFRGAGLADTPATTGRALWLRTIPEGKVYPVLSDEVRELIAATSGQGRIELRPAPGPGAPALRTVSGGFTYLDGRFMYAALTWGMPVGAPTRWTGAEVDALDAAAFQSTMRGRGRWRITARVPETWEHVGILMAPEDGGGWRYPSRPGEVFTTWADGSEVWLALSHGWEVRVHEGLSWAEGKPLDAWRNSLVKVWEACVQNGSEQALLASRAVRSILLYAIGAFATRAHPVTRSAPLDADPEVPAGTQVRRVGDNLVWQEPGRLSDWSLETSHPEWSATVWARARTRLLTGRDANNGMAGALHLDPARVVGFATDALYLAGGPPPWADDGKPGRFRVKGRKPGNFAWPESYAELWRLRDKAEDGEG